MPDVAKLSVVVDADTSAAERGLDSLGGKVGGIGSSIATAFGGAALAGIAGLAAGLSESVQAASGFEKTMSAVKAVSGATADEMENLSGLALQLGKDTSFSASEAGKGIEELVKGGLSIPDIMNGAAEATLNLAAAGGVSLPEAATIAANALAQFNLKGEDMGHVADLIAGAANASALDVSDFAYSLKAAGAVASTVGFDFDDLAQAIAVMGKAGITGSDAGTSLKTMMLNLQPSTNAQRDLFRDLGITTLNSAKALEAFKTLGMEPVTGSLADQEKALKMAVTGWDGVKKMTADQEKAWITGADKLRIYDNAFFDANGSVKSMADVAEVLQTSLAGMTDAQRIATLEVMFGSDAIRAGAVLAKEGAAGFNEMAASMGKVSAASVGAEKLNNLAGAWEQLKGSLETAAIMIGMQLLPALTQLTKWATDAVNAVIPKLESIGGTLEDTFGPDVASTIRVTMTEIRQTVDEVMRAISLLMDHHGSDISAAWNGSTKALLSDTLTLTREMLAAIRLFAKAAAGDWEGVWSEMTRISDLEGQRQTAAMQRNADLTQKAIDNLTGGALSVTQQWMTDTGKAISDGWSDFVTRTSDGASKILTAVETAWNTAKSTTDTIWRAIANVLTAIWGEIYDQVVKPKLDAITGAVDTAWQSISSQTKALLDPVLAYVRDSIFDPIRAAVEAKVNAARDLAAAAWQAISDKAHAILDPVLSYVSGNIFGPMQAKVESASTGISTAFTGAVDSVKRVVDTTLGAIRNTWETTWTAIQRAAESPQEAMQVLTELVAKLKRIMPEWLIPHSPTPFQIGLEGVMKAVRGMDSAFGDMSGVDGWLRAAMRLAGVGEDWLPGLMRLAGWESTGNPRAVNPTPVGNEHATGLMQTLPSTFRHYALPGMDDIFNPIHNAAAAIRYIMATYGSVYRIPGIASGNHGEFPGYAEGGIVTRPQLAWVGEREPEAIIPRSWFGQGGGGGGHQTMTINVAIGGRVAEQIYVEGRELAIRRGRA